MKTEKDERGHLIRVCGDSVELTWNAEKQQWTIQRGNELIALISLPGYCLSINQAKVTQDQQQEIRNLTGFLSNYMAT